MKRLTVLALVLALLLTLTACGGGETQDAGANGDDNAAANGTTDNGSTDEGTSDGDVKLIRIGYAFSNMDENMQRSLRGFEAAVADYNAANTDTQVEMIYTDAQSNVDKQLADVESMILQECDVILLNSVDAVGCVPAAEAIHNAGIVCIEMRGMVSDAVDLTYQGTDELSISNLVKEFLVEKLEADPDLVYKAGLIYGNPSHTTNLLRHDAILELAEEMPDRFQILDSRYGNWSTDEAMGIMEDWIQIYGGEMNLVCSASDAMSLGVTNVLASANLLDSFTVTSVDGTKIGEGLVEEGKLDVTIKMLMTARSYDLLDIALQVYNGEYTDKLYNAGAKNVGPVTAENVAEMKEID